MPVEPDMVEPGTASQESFLDQYKSEIGPMLRQIAKWLEEVKDEAIRRADYGKAAEVREAICWIGKQEE